MQTVNLINQNSRTIGTQDALIAYILFILHPLLGIGAMFLLCIATNTINKNIYYSLYFLISIFLGLVNSTRIPESDLLSYNNIFDDAGRFSLSTYIGIYGFKEIVYFIFSYLSYFILFGNFKLFLVLVTFIQYYLIFISLHKLFRDENKIVILSAVLILFFNSSLFFPSVHLLRQMLASSIFIYYFTCLYTNKKNYWWLILIAFLIHSSSLLLFLIILIPGIKNKINLRTLIILLSVFIVFYLFGDTIISFLDNLTSGVPFLNYPFSRIPNLELMEYSWYEGKFIWPVRFNSIIFFVLPTLFVYFSKKLNINFYPFLNFFIIYIIILELFISSGLTYMQMRMSYYLNPFYAFSLPIFISDINKKYDKNISLLFALFIIAFMIRGFIKSYLSTDFLIEPIDKFILNPFFYYVINIFS
jgi:hypothetical protein